jgi:hypothetical protein
MSSPSRTRARRSLREASSCPDCRSTVRVLGDNHVEVQHDDTCPWWRARGSVPFSVLRITPTGATR